MSTFTIKVFRVTQQRHGLKQFGDMDCVVQDNKFKDVQDPKNGDISIVARLSPAERHDLKMLIIQDFKTGPLIGLPDSGNMAYTPFTPRPDLRDVSIREDQRSSPSSLRVPMTVESEVGNRWNTPSSVPVRTTSDTNTVVGVDYRRPVSRPPSFPLVGLPANTDRVYVDFLELPEAPFGASYIVCYEQGTANVNGIYNAQTAERIPSFDNPYLRSAIYTEATKKRVNDQFLKDDVQPPCGHEAVAVFFKLNKSTGMYDKTHCCCVSCGVTITNIMCSRGPVS